MKLRVLHRTLYRYASPVRQSINEARVQPVDEPRQRRRTFELLVRPSATLHHQVDFYGNNVHFFEVSDAHGSLEVEARSEVETTDSPLFGASDCPAPLALLRDSPLPFHVYDYLQPSTYVDDDVGLGPAAARSAAGIDDVWQAARALMGHVHSEFQYQPSVTHSHTVLSEALRLRRGVCQDFAHVLVGLCRAAGMPARYVSGYLYNGPVDQLKGAQASHAWVEVWVPGHGWAGLDPTNNTAADGRYVKAAAGRDYADAAPLKGTYRGTAERSLSVEVLVTRLD